MKQSQQKRTMSAEKESASLNAEEEPKTSSVPLHSSEVISVLLAHVSPSPILNPISANEAREG